MCETAEPGGLFSQVSWERRMCQLSSQSGVPMGALSTDPLRVLRACLRMAAQCRQAPPWALGPRREMCQFSAARAAFQPGTSKDLLEYRFLPLSLASELFVASPDMKITCQKGMILLLPKKNGFCLSSERAVMMVGFFPCHFELQLCSGAGE